MSMIAAAANLSGSYLGGKLAEKSGKLRSKESNRETKAALIQDALQRSAEMQNHRLSTRNKLGKRRSQSLQDTSDLLRGAFNI